jgi:twitching motility protein PilT
MHEIIVGTGKQSSCRSIASIADAQLHPVEGVPKKLVARSDGIELTAHRPDFDSDFDQFALKLSLDGYRADCVRENAPELGNLCSMVEEDEHLVAHFPGAAASGSSVEEVHEAVDKFSTCLKFPEVWRVHGEEYRVDPISVELLFRGMIQYKASDVHLAPGETAIFRVDNKINHSDMFGKVSANQILSLIRQIAGDRDWKEFEEAMQTSFNFHQVGMGYARVSAFYQSGAPHITFRYLPEKIPSFEELHIPRDTLESLSDLHHGLVLVTGMTGSGKSTTVAAMVDWINTNKPLHILTIENPVEYVHFNKRAVISQRSTGTDVRDFGDAVAGALRHDPDVIVIGEMRDPDTIRSAINAAATGHLVISTLHSNTASEVVNRIVSFFDPVERDLVRLQLRDALRCVICQRLVPKKGGGRLPIIEVMFNDIKPINDGVIRGNTDLIRIGMQQSVSHSFLFEEYLHTLLREENIDIAVAREFASDRSILEQMIMGTYSIPRLDAIKHVKE